MSDGSGGSVAVSYRMEADVMLRKVTNVVEASLNPNKKDTDVKTTLGRFYRAEPGTYMGEGDDERMKFCIISK